MKLLDLFRRKRPPRPAIYYDPDRGPVTVTTALVKEPGMSGSVAITGNLVTGTLVTRTSYDATTRTVESWPLPCPILCWPDHTAQLVPNTGQQDSPGVTYTPSRYGAGLVIETRIA